MARSASNTGTESAASTDNTSEGSALMTTSASGQSAYRCGTVDPIASNTLAPCTCRSRTIVSAFVPAFSASATGAQLRSSSRTPESASWRVTLASSYRTAGRKQEGAELQDRVIADSERLLGSDHPATKAARRTRELN